MHDEFGTRGLIFAISVHRGLVCASEASLNSFWLASAAALACWFVLKEAIILFVESDKINAM